MAGWCSQCNFSLWCFQLTIVTLLLQDAAITGSTVSKVALLKPYRQPWVLLLKSDHNCHMHGKLKSLNWYCCLWRRMEMSLSLTESTGWSFLLWMYQTNSTDNTRHQSSKLGLWSQVFKAKSLVRNFTDLQCVLIINCLPQTVQVEICRLVCLPDIGWSGGKTGLFQAMLSWQHRWADLQWLSTVGSLLLTPNSFPLNV